MKQSVAEQVMFFQLALGQSGREMRTVNGNVEFFQDIRQRAKMVFVSVGKNYGSNVLTILFEEIEVRNANVNPVGGFFWKPHARVKDEHFILISHSHAIHPKLADAAERNDL